MILSEYREKIQRERESIVAWYNSHIEEYGREVGSATKMYKDMAEAMNISVTKVIYTLKGAGVIKGQGRRKKKRNKRK